MTKFDYKQYGIVSNTKCKICEETAAHIRKNYEYGVEEGSFSEKLDGWVCGTCRHDSDSQGTILIYQPKKQQIDKYVIYAHEDAYGFEDNINDIEDISVDVCDIEQCPIQFAYHRTDGWRGYYEPESEQWKTLHSDCILSGSKDAEDLKKFDTDIKQILWDLGFDFALCFGRTSNVFSCGYDILIRKNQETDIIKTMTLYMKLMKLRARYRNNERFRLTALTGKSENFNKKDKLLLEGSERLKKGEDFETVKEDIMKRV